MKGLKGLPEFRSEPIRQRESSSSRNKMKDLGIKISENLTCTTHVGKRAQFALTALFTLKRNLAITTYFIRKSAYISYVVPIVNYGSSLWLPSKGDLRIIESIQRKTMKLIFGSSNLDY